jgi:hypothetical protein
VPYDRLVTTSPAEVEITTRRSALVQRVLAGVTIVAVGAGAVLLSLSGEAWWAILLGDLALLFTALIMLALWFSASESEQQTTALLAGGTKVSGEVLEKAVHDDGETVYRELTVRIPLADAGFQGHHRCSHTECADLEPGSRVTVLVDPVTRAWAVLH